MRIDSSHSQRQNCPRRHKEGNAEGNAASSHDKHRRNKTAETHTATTSDNTATTSDNTSDNTATTSDNTATTPPAQSKVKRRQKAATQKRRQLFTLL
jgi:hypothetical protein